MQKSKRKWDPLFPLIINLFLLQNKGFWGLVVIQVPGPGSRVPGPGPGPGPGPKFWYQFKSSHIKFNRDSEFATNPTIDLL